MVLLSPSARSVVTSGRLAHLATIDPDGSPQMSAVWVGLDGDDIVTAHLMGGRKVQNIARDPRVSLTMEADGDNGIGMKNYLIVRGTARLEDGGAPELLQRLAEIYIGPGVKFPPMDNPPPGHVIRITPTKVGGLGALGVTGELPEHVAENRRTWDEDAVNWVESGEREWARHEPSWGMWGIPQSELPLLPDDMTGLDAIELGCGTGYISAWMTRRGARVTGLDNSEAQLATARRLASEHEIDITWIHGNAESVPRPGASFDFVISEYGAVLWCDPYVWVPEAARLLRPGGRMVTLSTSTLAHTCMPQDGAIPCTDRLERPSFGMHRFDWREAADEPGGIEFNLMVSEWFRLFRDTGFVIEDFRELRAPHRGTDVNFFVTADWANDHPSEQVWVARKR